MGRVEGGTRRLTGEAVCKAISAAIAPITLSLCIEGLVECVSVSSASTQGHARSSGWLLGVLVVALLSWCVSTTDPFEFRICFQPTLSMIC
jgi:hypothetical protein